MVIIANNQIYCPLLGDLTLTDRHCEEQISSCIVCIVLLGLHHHLLYFLNCLL